MTRWERPKLVPFWTSSSQTLTLKSRLQCRIMLWTRIRRRVTQWARQSLEFATEIEGKDTVLISEGTAIAHAHPDCVSS